MCQVNSFVCCSPSVQTQKCPFFTPQLCPTCYQRKSSNPTVTACYKRNDCLYFHTNVNTAKYVEHVFALLPYLMFHFIIQNHSNKHNTRRVPFQAMTLSLCSQKERFYPTQQHTRSSFLSLCNFQKQQAVLEQEHLSHSFIGDYFKQRINLHTLYGSFRHHSWDLIGACANNLKCS